MPPQESAVVLVGHVADNTMIAPFLEKRATLKVKPDTVWFSVTFVDGSDRNYKTERIKIK